MKNEDVYLGGNYGKDGIISVYGLAVYFGHKDPRCVSRISAISLYHIQGLHRNISWKCSSTVKDVNGAELEVSLCRLSLRSIERVTRRWYIFWSGAARTITTSLVTSRSEPLAVLS